MHVILVLLPRMTCSEWFSTNRQPGSDNIIKQNCNTIDDAGRKTLAYAWKDSMVETHTWKDERSTHV